MFIVQPFPTAQLARECFCGTFTMVFCRPRRIAVQQRLKLAAREVGARGVHKIATVQVHCTVARMEPDRETKMTFATTIQSLTLSRRFLTPRQLTPEVFQWLFSRARQSWWPPCGWNWLLTEPWVHRKLRQCRRSNSTGTGRRLVGTRFGHYNH